jgi:hypothetical protein
VKLIEAPVSSVNASGAPVNTGAAGAAVSTVQLAVAALDVLPAASVALTERLCAPSASELRAFGLEPQAVYEAAPSTAQVNVAPASPVNVIDALFELVRLAGAPLKPGAAGAVASTVHDAVAEPSAALLASSCDTTRVCAPSARPEVENEAEHEAAVPPSSEHVAVSSGDRSNANDALVEFTSEAGFAENTGIERTVHEAEATGDALPAWSVCFTANECAPSANEVNAFGDEPQAEYEPPSTEHVNVAFASPVKPIEADLVFTTPVGAPERTGATGAVRSTVQVKLPASETLRDASVALTLRVCDPAARPVRLLGDVHAE